MSDYVSPALERMAARAKLPIRVKCFGDGDLLMVSDSEWRMTFTTPHHDIASSFYFRLVESLSPPPLSPSPGTPSEAGSAAITDSSPPWSR